MTFLYVTLGASLGAPVRLLAGHLLDAEFPWGTVLVNVLGSFLMGLLSGAALPQESAALLSAGFCGGLTTYSAFAVQTFDHGVRRGAANVLLTIPPALAACVLGYTVTS